MISGNIFYIVTSVDVDEDDYDRIKKKRKTVQWLGVEKGVPLILKKLGKYRDSTNNEIKYTWFVRCDKQLEILYGRGDYLLHKYIGLLRERFNSDDEIAWHAHLYDHDLSILQDEKRLLADIQEFYKLFKSHSLHQDSSRIGRAYCSNHIIKALFKSGIQVDSTAMPGRKRNDEINKFDWETTPLHPYYPSKSDYRIPGKDHFKILEVPFSMIKTMTSYDKKPINRYVNLSFKNSIIKKSLSSFITRNNLLITILHPSELILKKEHPILSFNIDDVKKNIELILYQCDKLGKKVNFITIHKLRQLSVSGINNGSI